MRAFCHCRLGMREGEASCDALVQACPGEATPWLQAEERHELLD